MASFVIATPYDRISVLQIPIYGTHIIVSEKFYQQIKHRFILRKVDRIIVKGKYTSMDIYELLAENRDEISFDLEKYENRFAQGFKAYEEVRFEEALFFFNECLAIYPEDSVAKVFIERVQFFLHYPPPADWKGIWRLSEK